MGGVRERAGQERSTATRASLLDAALECLVERGYAATTTTEISSRAGVSRGAQLHHFPTKVELLTAAVGQLLERRTAEFRQAFEDFDPGRDRVETAIDLLWSMYQGPTFTACAELWLAARTDPELKPAVVEMDRRFMETSYRIFFDLFPRGEGVDPALYETGLRFAYALMDGLAMQRMIECDDPVPAERVIDTLKVILQAFDPGTTIEEAK